MSTAQPFIGQRYADAPCCDEYTEHRLGRKEISREQAASKSTSCHGIPSAEA